MLYTHKRTDRHALTQALIHTNAEESPHSQVEFSSPPTPPLPTTKNRWPPPTPPLNTCAFFKVSMLLQQQQQCTIRLEKFHVKCIFVFFTFHCLFLYYYMCFVCFPLPLPLCALFSKPTPLLPLPWRRRRRRSRQQQKVSSARS